MIVNPIVMDVCTTWKESEKKQQPAQNQKNTKHQNVS